MILNYEVQEKIYPVSFQTVKALGKLETELTKVNNRYSSQLFRVGREVPWLDEMFSQLNHLNVLHTCDDVVMTTIMNHTASSP